MLLCAAITAAQTKQGVTEDERRARTQAKIDYQLRTAALELRNGEDLIAHVFVEPKDVKYWTEEFDYKTFCGHDVQVMTFKQYTNLHTIFIKVLKRSHAT